MVSDSCGNNTASNHASNEGVRCLTKEGSSGIHVKVKSRCRAGDLDRRGRGGRSKSAWKIDR